MKTIGGLAILAILAVGCGGDVGGPDDATSDATGPADRGSDSTPAEAGRNCGLVAGEYATHWTRWQGTCGASGDLDVTISDPGDICGAIGQHVPAGLGSGEFSVGCVVDVNCAVTAAIGFHGCQGSYTIVLSPK